MRAEETMEGFEEEQRMEEGEEGDKEVCERADPVSVRGGRRKGNRADLDPVQVGGRRRGPGSSAPA